MSAKSSSTVMGTMSRSLKKKTSSTSNYTCWLCMYLHLDIVFTGASTRTIRSTRAVESNRGISDGLLDSDKKSPVKPSGMLFLGILLVCVFNPFNAQCHLRVLVLRWVPCQGL